jgi:hypothetical protein
MALLQFEMLSQFSNACQTEATVLIQRAHTFNDAITKHTAWLHSSWLHDLGSTLDRDRGFFATAEDQDIQNNLGLFEGRI